MWDFLHTVKKPYNIRSGFTHYSLIEPVKKPYNIRRGFYPLQSYRAIYYLLASCFSVIFFIVTSSLGLSPSPVSTAAILSTTSMPEIT